MSELIRREDAINAVEMFFKDSYIEDADVHCTDMVYEINQIPTAPRWVRCEERLPDDTFKQVLITDGTHFGLAYCLDLGVYGVKWRKTNWMSIGGLFRGKITHWMPIEPPKEDA